MNKKQRENTGKMFYDLVKVPLAVCCFGAIAAEHSDLIYFVFFGLSISMLFFYIGYQMDSEL
ncbi:hypothetical protein [Endozoicomonas euniceicola]|uniref:Uncharacterized protein n=1 Tax=Endozoicomonas euniceicola TaxID=1234143 RepID=A0ABY6GMT6_9GAMM|nr:hypothetical protein [Endozoicomonas euniceicola]UYM14018.1 hypothetical protein NX720_13965 [Endozoicomonas euniceicola]